jgi:putative transposon-encoded protein
VAGIVQYYSKPRVILGALAFVGVKRMKARWSVALGALCFLLGTLGSTFLLGIMESCIHGTPKENITEIKRGDFKILVRSQEFHNSAIQNMDICVANSSSTAFPRDGAQCFLHGFDFSGLSARWKTGREIEVSFTNGRVTHFTNSAIVSAKDSLPVEFYVTLCDGCTTQ